MAAFTPDFATNHRWDDTVKVSAIGIGWYKRDDYPRILSIMEDADDLPGTYDDFLKGFEAGKRQLEEKGLFVITAVIEPDEFLVWCRDRHLKVDAQARMRFASENAAIVMQQFQRGT